MYQRVQKVDCSFPRAVLILGPLVEAIKDMLVKEAPAKFCRCVPGEFLHIMSLILLKLIRFVSLQRRYFKRTT